MPRAWGATESSRTVWRVPPRSTSTSRPGARLGAGLWYGRRRTRPRRLCAPTISPTATAATAASWGLARVVVPAGPTGPASLVLDDLEDDFSVGTGGGRIQDGADGFRGAPLFADDAPQ